MPQHNLIDLTGRRFGRWTVLAKGPSFAYSARVPTRKRTAVRARWLCRCDCGKEVLVVGIQLRRGTSKSCGCYRNELNTKRFTKHGLCHETRTRYGWRGSPVYEMWRGAKERARKLGLPIDLKLTDIVVPPVCPVFGTPLVSGTGGFPCPDSPSLDRIIPALGYVRSNVRVISHRANTLKRDGTIEEFEKIINYMKKEETLANCD